MDSPEVIPEKLGGEMLHATQFAEILDFFFSWIFLKWFLKHRAEVPEKKQQGATFHSQQNIT